MFILGGAKLWQHLMTKCGAISLFLLLNQWTRPYETQLVKPTSNQIQVSYAILYQGLNQDKPLCVDLVLISVEEPALNDVWRFSLELIIRSSTVIVDSVLSVKVDSEIFIQAVSSRHKSQEFTIILKTEYWRRWCFFRLHV